MSSPTTLTRAQKRAIRARRAAAAQQAGRLPGKPRPTTPGTNPALRPEPVANGAQVPRNRRAVRMTATQRDSTGRMSAWNRSPYAPYGGWR